MRRALLPMLLSMIVVAAWAPPIARAEVIDFDPRNDTVPEILTAEEMDLYDQLRPQGRPGIISGPSPNGQYVFVSGVGAPGYAVLDVDAGEIRAIGVDVWNPALVQRASPFTWVSDSRAAVLTCNRDQPTGPCDFAKTIVDVQAETLETQTFTMGSIEGKRIAMVTGRPLLRTTDGSFHNLAYTVQTGAIVERIRVPSYAAQTAEAVAERAALGTDQPDRLILTTDELLVAVSLEDGSITTIGSLATGTSLSTALSSVSQRPGTDTVSYVVAPEITCAGIVQRQRGCRGGGMPTSYWLVQESLGRIPPEENRFLTEPAVHLADLSNGNGTVIPNATHAPGRFRTTLWTADGSRLLVIGLAPSELQGRAHPVYGSPSGLIFKVFSPDGTFVRDWTPDVAASVAAGVEPLDGTRLLAMRPWNTNRHVYILDAGTPDAEPVPVFTGQGALYSWALSGAAFVYVLGDVTNPGELYLAEAGDVAGTSRALTNINGPLLETSKLRFQPIAYTTSAGYEVEGTYVYPADRSFPPEEPQPVVVWQAGGPGGQMTNSWGTSVESPYSLLPNYGIPVFIVNGSGRTSNDPQFYSDMADADNYGQRDIRDVKEGVDRLIESGVADPDAIGVTGCSYGGYFTLQSMVEYPGFYAAGNTQCSLNDLMWEYNFGWSQTIGYLMGGAPAGAAAEYLRDSPTYRAYQIREPLLVFHGTNDFLPFEHMTNVHDQVETSGVPARFLRALGEGHGFGSAASQRYAMQLQIDWFRTHLDPGSGRFGLLSETGEIRALPMPARVEVPR